MNASAVGGNIFKSSSKIVDEAALEAIKNGIGE